MKKDSIINRHKTDIGERKDVENAIAGQEKRDAILDYIAACDHPEVFENDSEVMEDE